MGILQQRADYLLGLMPRFSRGIQQRVALREPAAQHLLTFGQMQLLVRLEQGPATMGEMARQVRVTLATLSGTVDRLVRQGLVERRPDLQDRRLVRIQLSARGRACSRRYHAHARKRFEILLSTLTEKEQQEMIKAFETIERILLAGRRPAARPGRA